MTTRQYTSRSQQSTLTGAITAGTTSMSVVSGSNLLGTATIPNGTTFTLVIDPDTALEEIVDATAVSTNTFTITRSIDGSSAQSHSAGAVVRHMAIGRDFRDANLHAEASGSYNDGAGVSHTMHGLGSSDGVVVGTDKAQTLTQKTLTSPTISNPTFTGTSTVGAVLHFEGTTSDDYETILTVVDPTQDNTITLPNTGGIVILDTASQTLTSKTLTSPIISGSPTITGLSSAGMVSSSAAPVSYVDAFFGPLTSAQTSAASAATSAASAATSATSASNSATASATSASAAATSATSAATSATSAAASATAAATSATSAAASESAVAASAAAAATSAASASTSASSALTSANSASTSASSALTSANSAATSASTMAASVAAAQTSATSAAASATAAATSATSAAASATAAATSATSASASATAAAADATTAANSVASIAAYATTASNSASAAATSATSAATSASSAATSASSALTSANSAATSASSAATSYDSFDDRYLGAKSSPPTLDNDGNPLLTGALYWNTANSEMYVYTGSAWTGFASTTVLNRYRYTAAGGETSVSGPDDNGNTLAYTAGKEQVYLNGVFLVRAQDYTATNGTSITGFSPALAASDVVEILAFQSFSVATAIPVTTFDAKGDLLVASNADEVGRIGVGANDTVLTADSNQALGVKWASPLDLTLNAQTAGYTLALTDKNKLVTVSSTSALTVTVPLNSSVAFPTGSQVHIARLNTGTVTVSGTSGVTVNSTGATTASPTLRAQYSTATCIKTDTNTWLVIGDIA